MLDFTEIADWSVPPRFDSPIPQGVKLPQAHDGQSEQPELPGST